MAKAIEQLQVRLEVAGLEDLAKLKGSFRALGQAVAPADAALSDARKAVLDFAASSKQSVQLIEGQIQAFKGLRAQAAAGGGLYRQLTADIKRLESASYGASEAIEQQRKQLTAVGTSANATVPQIRQAVNALVGLRTETRTDSNAFNKFGQSIDAVSGRLREVTAEAQAYADARRRSAQDIGVSAAAAKQQLRDIELVTKALRQQRDELGALEGQRRIRRGAADLAEQGVSSQGRLSYEEAVAQSLLGGVEFKRLLPTKAIQAAIDEVKRQLSQLQQEIEVNLSRGIQRSFQETAREARESARSAAAAFSSPEFLKVFNDFDKRLGELPRTSDGFSQRLRELQQVFANTAVSAKNYVTVALEIARVQREASAATQGLGAALVRDLDAGVAARSQKNLQEAIGQLKQEMLELDTTTTAGARAYAENANQVRVLERQLKQLAEAYRSVGDVASRAAGAQGGVSPFLPSGARNPSYVSPRQAAAAETQAQLDEELKNLVQESNEQRKREIQTRIENLRAINAENEARREQASIDRSIRKGQARIAANQPPEQLSALEQNREAVLTQLALQGRELSSLYEGIVNLGTASTRRQQAMMGRTGTEVLTDIFTAFNQGGQAAVNQQEDRRLSEGAADTANNVTSTFSASIKSGASKMAAAAKAAFNQVRQTINDVFGIASPSRFIIELVQNLASTYVSQLQKEYPRIREATQRAFGDLPTERPVRQLTATGRGFEFVDRPSTGYRPLPVRSFEPSGAGGEMDEMLRRFRYQIAQLTTQPEIYKNILNALPSSALTTDLTALASERARGAQMRGFMDVQRQLGPGELERYIQGQLAESLKGVRSPDPWVGPIGDYKKFINSIVAITDSLVPLALPSGKTPLALPPAASGQVKQYGPLATVAARPRAAIPPAFDAASMVVDVTASTIKDVEMLSGVESKKLSDRVRALFTKLVDGIRTTVQVAAASLKQGVSDFRSSVASDSAYVRTGSTERPVPAGMAAIPKGYRGLAGRLAAVSSDPVRSLFNITNAGFLNLPTSVTGLRGDALSAALQAAAPRTQARQGISPLFQTPGALPITPSFRPYSMGGGAGQSYVPPAPPPPPRPPRAGAGAAPVPPPPEPTSYQRLTKAVEGFGRASDRSTQDLREFLSTLRSTADILDPTAADFAKVNRTIEQQGRIVERELERRQQTARRFSAGQLAQTAGAALSGAVFGGPEGFLGGVIGGIAGGPGGAFAGAAAGAQVAMLRQAAAGTAEYAAAINQQRRALSGVVEDSAAYQQSLAFIDQTSRQLAIPQEQVTRNFTRLSASVLGAGGDVAAAQEAFMGISAGIRATGGTLGDLDAALLATAQVFSKGKVSAEELRGQIGERLPGAFTLFAKSINKTPQELDKMLEKGEVSLNDFMSFVRLMSSDFGQQALKMAASSEAAGDRLATAMGRMQEEVGKALQPIGAQFQEIFADLITQSGPAITSTLVAIGQATLALTQVVVSSVRGIQAVLDTLRQQVQNIVDTWLARWRILTDFISSAFTTAARTVGVDLQWLSSVFSGVADFIERIFGRVFSGVASRWKETVSNMINYSTPLGWVAKLMGVDPGKAVVAGIQAAGGRRQQQSAQPQFTPLPRSTATFGTGEADAAGGAKEKKGPKPPEDRTLELRDQLKLLIAVGKLEDRIRDLRFQGRERLALEDELSKELAQIESERVRSLRDANYEGERAHINAIAQAKQVAARRQSEDAIRALLSQRFQQELQNRQAVRDAAKPIEDIRKAQEQQLSDAKEYLRLVSEGMLPEEAKRIINFERTVLQQKDILDTQIQITEAAILEAKGRGAAVSDLEKELALLKQRRDAIVAAAAQGPGRGQTNVERIQDALAATKGELNELTNLGNLVVNSANAIGDAFGQAFQKLVTGAASAKQVLSDFFQSVANAFFEMASQIIAKQLVMITLQAILKALGGAPGTSEPSSFGPDNPVGDYNFDSTPIPADTEFPVAPTKQNAKGNVFSPQGHMEAYAKGGVIKAPTLFRYANGGGGFNTGLMGEAGPEAILPLRRTPDGRLGVSQVRSPQGGDTRMSEMMGRSPAQQQAPTLNLKFETTTINGVEYVSREQLEVAMAQTRRQAANDGAKRGMTMTLDKMRNSPRTRAQVGMR